MTKRQFCRDLCLERDEPLEGTGNTPQRMLLLAWPRGKWRAPRWDAVDMSPELSEAVQTAAKAGVFVSLVDRVGDSDCLAQLSALPECVSANFEDEADLIEAIRNYANGDVFEGQADPRITVMCCTDSRRDACCAKFGFSTYKALDAIADPKRFNIVQATHLGGCRFAASLIVMPHRHRYGRMTAGQAPALLEALDRNEVFLPAYRGRSDWPETMQVAELAALKWAATNSYEADNIQVESNGGPDEPKEGDEANIQVIMGHRQLDIQLKSRVIFVQGNCDSVAKGDGLLVPRWCLARVTETTIN